MRGGRAEGGAEPATAPRGRGQPRSAHAQTLALPAHTEARTLRSVPGLGNARRAAGAHCCAHPARQPDSWAQVPAGPPQPPFQGSRVGRATHRREVPEERGQQAELPEPWGWRGPSETPGLRCASGHWRKRRVRWVNWLSPAEVTCREGLH